MARAKKPKTAILHTRLTQEADDKLRAVAEHLGVSMTAVVEMAIRQMHKAVIEKDEVVVDGGTF